MEFTLEELAEIKEALRVRSFAGTPVYQKVCKEIDILKGQKINTFRAGIRLAFKNFAEHVRSIEFSEKDDCEIFCIVAQQFDECREIKDKLSKQIDRINEL